MVSEARSVLGPDPIIVACGGIFEAKDVWNALASGADLCQGYTGFIYEGLSYADNINKELKKIMDDKKIRSTDEIKGEPLL